MTTHHQLADRNRDLQDSNERHGFKSIEYVKGGGHVVKVAGTGTEDPEVIAFNGGAFGKFMDDTDAEVTLISLGSDTNLKIALIAIPHDKERDWKKGANGIQKYDDKDKAVEFNEKRTHSTDPNFAVGKGLFEVKDGQVYFRVPVHIPQLRAVSVGAPNVPAFDE